jgi:hypothetical protein
VSTLREQTTGIGRRGSIHWQQPKARVRGARRISEFGPNEKGLARRARGRFLWKAMRLAPPGRAVTLVNDDLPPVVPLPRRSSTGTYSRACSTQRHRRSSTPWKAWQAAAAPPASKRTVGFMRLRKAGLAAYAAKTARSRGTSPNHRSARWPARTSVLPRRRSRRRPRPRGRSRRSQPLVLTA